MNLEHLRLMYGRNAKCHCNLFNQHLGGRCLCAFIATVCGTKHYRIWNIEIDRHNRLACNVTAAPLVIKKRQNVRHAQHSALNTQCSIIGIYTTAAVTQIHLQRPNALWLWEKSERLQLRTRPRLSLESVLTI